MLESAETDVVHFPDFTIFVQEELTMAWEGMICYVDEMLSLTEEFHATIEDLLPSFGSPIIWYVVVGNLYR